MGRRARTGYMRRSLLTRLISVPLAALLLRSGLDFMYVNYVNRYFGGSFAAGAFPFVGYDLLRLVESYALVFVLAMLVVLSLHERLRPSGAILVLYLVGVLIPLTSLYGLADAPASFVYAAGASYTIVLAVTHPKPGVRIPRPGRLLTVAGVALIAVMSVYVYGMLLLSGGLERLSFDFTAVYEVRDEFVETRGPLMGYLVPWQATVFNTALLCYGLASRRYWTVGISALAQLLIFGMTGHKSFALAPILAASVYLIWNTKRVLVHVFVGATVLLYAAYLAFLLNGDHLLPSLLIRRLFFVPAANHLIYYDFFSQPENPFVLLSNSFLGPFIAYPYDMPLTRVIAWEYWSRDFGPNVGYLGDAFAQFGFAGMFVFSFILGAFLRIVDAVSIPLPTRLGAAVLSVPGMALINSALFTSLLTHGLIPAIVVVWILRAVAQNRRAYPQRTVAVR